MGRLLAVEMKSFCIYCRDEYL